MTPLLSRSHVVRMSEDVNYYTVLSRWGPIKITDYHWEDLELESTVRSG
jgi:hypothetical protein